MDDFRSKSYGDGRMQMETYYSRSTNDLAGGGVAEGPPASGSNGYGGGLQDMRCYSASYATSAASQPPAPPMPRQLKKGKSTNASIGGAWCFSDPELQRKKRVAGYKVYTVEGKMKGSFRKSFKWVKDRYSQMLHGWR